VPQPRLCLDQPVFPHNFAIRMGLELRKYCIVGGNAVSAFLSWRLQATNACDVTLEWKANFQSVAQYGISFKYVHARQVPNFGWVGQKLTNYLQVTAVWKRAVHTSPR